MAEVTVLGIGNVLMRDEGIGVHLLKAVKVARDWPAGVEFIDGGAGGLNLLNVIEESRRLVVFDAAEMGLSPGRCHIIRPEQIAKEPLEHRASLHDVPLLETLKLCEMFLHRPQDIRIMVIQPANIEFGRELSPELLAAFDGLLTGAIEMVAGACRDAGLPAER